MESWCDCRRQGVRWFRLPARLSLSLSRSPGVFAAMRVSSRSVRVLGVLVVRESDLRERDA